MTTGKADEFIGGDLYALVPVSLMSAPNGSYLRTIDVNKYVGTIFSFVLNNGKVWWQLENKDTGEHVGYVMHEENKFNKQKLENSLIELKAKRDKEIEKAVDKRKEQNSIFGFLNDFENVFKTIMVLVILLVILNIVKK